MRISRVTLFPAGRISRRSGLYGWITLEMNGVPVFDGLTLRRTADGRYCVSYPARRGGRDGDHDLVRSLHDAKREAIERQVLDQLRLQGVIAE